MASQYDFPVHELAEAVPARSDESYQSLKDQVERCGHLTNPIVIHKGKLIDGRHRLRICEELGLEPWIVHDDDLESTGGDVALFIQAQCEHRDFSVTQRSYLAALFKPHCEKAAKERQARKPADSVQDACPEQKQQSRDEAGRSKGVSGRNVSRAEKVIASGNQYLIQAMRDDRVKVGTAERVVDRYQGDELEQFLVPAMASDSPSKVISEALAGAGAGKSNDQPADKVNRSFDKLDKPQKRKHWRYCNEHPDIGGYVQRQADAQARGGATPKEYVDQQLCEARNTVEKLLNSYANAKKRNWINGAAAGQVEGYATTARQLRGDIEKLVKFFEKEAGHVSARQAG